MADRTVQPRGTVLAMEARTAPVPMVRSVLTDRPKEDATAAPMPASTETTLAASTSVPRAHHRATVAAQRAREASAILPRAPPTTSLARPAGRVAAATAPVAPASRFPRAGAA